MPFKLSRVSIWSGVLAAAAIVILFARINGIRIATADELHALAGASDASLGHANRLLDLAIGRFYAVVKWPLLEFLLRDCRDGVLSLLRLAAFVACAATAAQFVRLALGKSQSGAYFMGLVCALLPVVVAYQPLFYNPLLWLGWACVWLMGAVSLRPDSHHHTILVPVLFALAMMSHEMNAVFVVWPWLVRGLVAGRGLRHGFSSTTVLCGIVLLLYGGIALTLRTITAPWEITYGGGTMVPDVKAAALSLTANSLGILPGLESWLNPRWQDIEGPLFMDIESFGRRLFANLDGVSIMLSAGAGWVTWLYLGKRDSALERARAVSHPALLGALLFMVFAPNLLLSTTGKYQGWVFQRMWPYYYSWMSYTALVMTAVVGLDFWRERWTPSNAKRLGASVSLALLVMLTAATARETTDFFRVYRFDHSELAPAPHSF